MILTSRQEEGLKEIVTRCGNHDKFVTIAGYAGTGKSTLVKVAIEALKVNPEDVAYATFTGKAAEVLRKKGNPGAITLHKLLYDHFPKPTGGYIRRPKERIDKKVVVVDEVSMVPRSMIELLLTHRAFVIFLGDPFQLPQIDKDESHDYLEHPHVFLDEIMRQEADSEIIKLTLAIRNMEPIDFYKGDQIQIMPKSQLVDGCYTWADQVITGTNATRRSVNDQMRAMLGFSGLPQDGEKMICLRNFWDDFSTNGDPLVNGLTGIIHNPVDTTIQIPPVARIKKKEVPVIRCDFEVDENNIFLDTPMDKTLITSGEPYLDFRENYRLRMIKNRIGDFLPRDYDFGYAITCHKAQGSSWEKVLVIEDKFPFDPIEHARWLYTACTRPEKKLVLVRN